MEDWKQPERGSSERFYRTLLENSFESVGIIDSQGVILFQNRAARDVLGAPNGELIGENALARIHPDDIPRAQNTLASLNDEPGAFRPEEVRMRRYDDDAYIDLEVRALNLKDDPEIRGILVNFRDVTKHRATIRALQESEQRLELALEGSGLGLWDWDLVSDRVVFEGVLPEVLGLTPTHTGYPSTEIFGRTHPDELPSVNDALQAHFEGRTEYFEHEVRLRLPDGSYFWVMARGRVVEREPDGSPKRMVGTQLDIDQRRREVEQRRQLEEQLQAAQRMESIGQLAGGIAHDFNNILQIMMANARFAASDPDDHAAVLECLGEIEKGGERAAQLTRQLLAFGRRQALQPQPCNLNELIEANLNLLRRVLPESISIDFIPGHRLATALVDPGQFEQVITNLCVNARDAMPNGGRLTLETENVVINGEYRQRHPWARPGRYILVTVTDTGQGMNEEAQGRAFEPFFTTKEEGTGSGLGLAMVHGIVRQHDGLIHLYSERDVGTSFKIYWPAVERPAEAVGKKLEGPVPGGREMILAVEDESSVRRLVAKILESAGYRVLEAANGEEALKLFTEHQEEIGLVLLDAVMPKKSGREVYESMRQVRDTPVLFTSGYSAASLPNEFLTRDQLEVLPKPYSPDLLLRKVRKVLDHHREKQSES